MLSTKEEWESHKRKPSATLQLLECLAILPSATVTQQCTLLCSAWGLRHFVNNLSVCLSRLNWPSFTWDVPYTSQKVTSLWVVVSYFKSWQFSFVKSLVVFDSWRFSYYIFMVSANHTFVADCFNHSNREISEWAVIFFRYRIRQVYFSQRFPSTDTR